MRVYHKILSLMARKIFWFKAVYRLVNKTGKNEQAVKWRILIKVGRGLIELDSAITEKHERNCTESDAGVYWEEGGTVI